MDLTEKANENSTSAPSGNFQKTVVLDFPPDVVDGSKKATVQIIGEDFFYRINVLLCLKGGLDVWQFFSTLILSLSWDGNDKSTEKKPLYYKRLDEAIHFFVKVAFPLILFRPEKGYFSRKINVSCSEFTIL